MTDTEYAARVKELKDHYVVTALTDEDELVAHYEAISASIGLKTPENHATELFLSASSETWAQAYGLFAKRYTHLLFLQMVALGGLFFLKAPQPMLLLAPAVLTTVFGILYSAKAVLISRGADKLDDSRSAAVKEYIYNVKLAAKEDLEERLAARQGE